MERLLIITTGGTIDKIYFDDKSDYQIGEPQIGQTFAMQHVAFDWEINALMRKDSLHFTDQDRLTILEAVTASDHDHILITHGTDTMVQTALSLDQAGEALARRRIVLTGALHPARFRDSDAEFNIGCALGALQCVAPGTWIVMNGRVWDPRRVYKNLEHNAFEEIPVD